MNIMILGSFEPICSVWERESFKIQDIARIQSLVNNGINACSAILEALTPPETALAQQLENIDLGNYAQSTH